MPVDPQELANDSKCFCGLSERQLLQVIAYASANAAGGSGGGGLAGSGSPEGAQTANPGTTYLNTDDDSFWVKKTGTGNTGWIELIA